MSADNSDGIKTYERVEFTFVDNYRIPKGEVVYFEKPKDWADDIYAYVYNTDDDYNRDWPGDQMKKESDGKYSYTFKTDWDNPLIIFNDGDAQDSEQYPGRNQKGLKVEAKKVYKVE